jgi:hypothetical protein
MDRRNDDVIYPDFAEQNIFIIVLKIKILFHKFRSYFVGPATNHAFGTLNGTASFNQCKENILISRGGTFSAFMQMFLI